jgi:hypothetical protein
VPGNITLVPLPPKCPAQNPVETSALAYHVYRPARINQSVLISGGCYQGLTIGSQMKPLGFCNVKGEGETTMLKTFCIALVFLASGGMMAARAQPHSATAVGPSSEENAPQTAPCPSLDCASQTHRSISEGSSPLSVGGTLIRGFSLSAPPSPWHPPAQAFGFY